MLNANIASTLCTAFVFLQIFVSASTQNYQCTTRSDCASSQCCTIGMQRFSTPVCTSLGRQGDYCRPNASSSNMTLSYPNGAILELTDVFTIMCPCDAQLGLSCQQGVCAHGSMDSPSLFDAGIASTNPPLDDNYNDRYDDRQEEPIDTGANLV